MPVTVNVPNVGRVTFPDGMTEAQITAEVEKMVAPPPTQRAEPAAAATPIDLPGRLEESPLVRAAIGAGRGVASSVFHGGDLIRRGLGMERVIDRPEVQSAITPQGTAEQVGFGAERAAEFMVPAARIAKATAKAPLVLRSLAQAGSAGGVGAAQSGKPEGAVVPTAIAGLTPVALAAPGALARLAGISKVRAGQNIQAATQAAKGAPVAVEKTGEAGLRAIDLGATGARLPRVVTQFMRRITDPKAADLGFDEARDFYSNLSRLSANEMGSMNPTMQRQVAAMRQALHEALTESAETVGKGSQYAKGISEYRRAIQAQELAKKAAKYGAGAIGAGAIGSYLID